MLKASIQLNENQLAMITSILLKHFGKVEFWLYGSRAKGTAKKFSDIDILVKGGKTFSLLEITNAKADFGDSELPYLVDITDWHKVSQGFLDVIKPDLIKIGETK